MKTKKKFVIGAVVVCALGYLLFHHKTRKVDDRDLVAGEIVVDFKDDVSPEEIAELGEKLGIKFRPESAYSATDKLYVGEYEGENEDDVIDELRNNSDVEAADKEEIYAIPEHNLPSNTEGLRISDIEADRKVNDPLYHKQWGMVQANVERSWNSKKGEGIIVAVLDTGIDRSLEDLANTKFVPGYNFIDDDNDTIDRQGHGSHCSGTIAQSTNNGLGVVGVAYKATLMPVKVLSDHGSGSSAGIAQGIHWATDHGAKVISMSLGGGGYDAVMAKAVKYAHDKGVFVAAANGNSKVGKVSYPAAYPGACAVAALQRDDKTAFYSNWGKETCIAAAGGAGNKNPDDGILQNTIQNGKPGYYSFSGTSMATPLIAGVAAVIMSEGVSDPDRVREILVETARVPKNVKKDAKFAEHYGAGIVDAGAAVKVAKGGGLLSGTHWYVYVLVAVLLFVIYSVVRRLRKR